VWVWMTVFAWVRKSGGLGVECAVAVDVRLLRRRTNGSGMQLQQLSIRKATSDDTVARATK
jgi:hypothetical protein